MFFMSLFMVGDAPHAWPPALRLGSWNSGQNKCAGPGGLVGQSPDQLDIPSHRSDTKQPLQKERLLHLLHVLVACPGPRRKLGPLRSAIDSPADDYPAACCPLVFITIIPNYSRGELFRPFPASAQRVQSLIPPSRSSPTFKLQYAAIRCGFKPFRTLKM